MPLFTIVEIDRDYRAWSGTETLEFPDLAAAEAHCREHSWTGYSYFVDKRSLQPAGDDRDPGVCRAG